MTYYDAIGRMPNDMSEELYRELKRAKSQVEISEDPSEVRSYQTESDILDAKIYRFDDNPFTIIKVHDSDGWLGTTYTHEDEDVRVNRKVYNFVEDSFGIMVLAPTED